MFQLIKWFEIPVADMNRAINFYSKVFTFIQFDLTEFNGVAHAIFKPSNKTSDFQMSGALVENRNVNDQKTGAILFFNGDLGMTDILERITKNGGEVTLGKTLIKNRLQDGSVIVPKTLIDQNVGYVAYFYDSEGNKMGLYSNS